MYSEHARDSSTTFTLLLCFRMGLQFVIKVVIDAGEEKRQLILAAKVLFYVTVKES